MSLGRSGCRGDGLLPPLEKGRVGEGIARRSILIPTRLARLADLPFSRGGKPSSSHYIDSTKIHHTLAVRGHHRLGRMVADARVVEAEHAPRRIELQFLVAAQRIV